jgi:hypothetical protein
VDNATWYFLRNYNSDSIFMDNITGSIIHTRPRLLPVRIFHNECDFPDTDFIGYYLVIETCDSKTHETEVKI